MIHSDKRLIEDFYKDNDDHWIVITTNIGWKKNGCNVMGAGLALFAKELCPGIDEWYGRRCQTYGSRTGVVAYPRGRFFLFPTKPLDEEKPWLSWNQESSLELVRRSAYQLVDAAREAPSFVGVPLVGCGNGKLRPEDVVPILDEILDDTFFLFRR